MADTQGQVVITPETLNKSFVKYRKELLMMPVYGLWKILPYLSVRQGVRYKETVGQLDGDMQLAPYNPLQLDTKDVTIKGRELETYLGSCVKAFDPNSVVQSIYGSNIVQGDGLKGVPITKAVCAFLMGKLGEHLYDCIFTAKRNSGGTTTAELFDGFKTIADKEKTAGNISTARHCQRDIRCNAQQAQGSEHLHVHEQRQQVAVRTLVPGQPRFVALQPAVQKDYCRRVRRTLHHDRHVLRA